MVAVPEHKEAKEVAPISTEGDSANPYLKLGELLAPRLAVKSYRKQLEEPGIIRHLRDCPDVLKIVARDLGDEGLHRFRAFRDGSSAITLETVEHQLVRLSKPSADHASRIYVPRSKNGMNSNAPSQGFGTQNARIWHPMILQPIKTFEYGIDGALPELRVEILPRAQRIYNNKHPGKLAIVEEALAKSGIIIPDLHNNNVGGFDLPGGGEMLLVLDVGLAQFKKSIGRCAKGEHLTPWMDGNIFKQCTLDPRVRQSPRHEGRLSGVLPPAMVDSYERRTMKSHRGQPSVVVQLLRQGFYPEEVGDILVRACERAGDHTEFHKMVKKEAESYDAHIAPGISSNAVARS